MLIKNSITSFGDFLEKKAFIGAIGSMAGKAIGPAFYAMGTKSSIKEGINSARMTRPSQLASFSRSSLGRAGGGAMRNRANSAGSFYR